MEQKLMEKKRKIYTVKGEDILIIGKAVEVADVIGYSVNHIRHLARTGKHFCLAGRDCSVSFVDLKETEE